MKKNEINLLMPLSEIKPEDCNHGYEPVSLSLIMKLGETAHLAWIFHELRWPASQGDIWGGDICNMPPQKATWDSRPYRLARRVGKVVTESVNLKGTNCNISKL